MVPAREGYDPAIPEWAAPAKPCGLVACIDVLEHIEPLLLDNVLDDLQRVTLGVGVFTVHTSAAVKVLPDGRNAHLIQEGASWWLPKFIQRFELARFEKMEQGFWIIVERNRGSNRDQKNAALSVSCSMARPEPAASTLGHY
jgi:hypothetical protein